MDSGKPIYGMHRGTIGFLMNEFAMDDLPDRLAAAHITVIHPLVMRARDTAGRCTSIAPSTKCRCSARARRPPICAS